MKKLFLLVFGLMLVLTACGEKEIGSTVSQESEKSSVVEESESLLSESFEALVSESSMESAESQEDAATSEETENTEETEEMVSFESTETSEETESTVEEESSALEQPVESTVPDTSEKEPETIPRLFLTPQPEGEYHVLSVGESLQLYSKIEGSEIEDAMLMWQVSDTSVIRLSGKCVTALSEGISTVTLSYSNGLMPVSVSFKVVAQESEVSE